MDSFKNETSICSLIIIPELRRELLWHSLIGLHGWIEEEKLAK